MPKAIGPRKIQRYTVEFKLTAVRLSNAPNVKVNDVADALDIHPFMLSRWRKEARDGKLKVRPPKPPAPPKKKPPKPKPAKKVRDDAGMNEAELAKFAELKRKHQDLQEAHDLLKKYIRFYSERKAKSSRSSIESGTGSPSATSAKSSK
jgi:transposase